MVYLAKANETVRVFYSEAKMKAAGFGKADKEVTEEEFNSNGCYARIVDGEIIVGKTEKEKQIEELDRQISEIDRQLSDLDNKYLTPRVLAGIALKSEYSLEQINAHETGATPLREERKALSEAKDAILKP